MQSQSEFCTNLMYPTSKRLRGKIWPQLRGSPHLSCKRDQIETRDYMDMLVTLPKRGPPPSQKQALSRKPTSSCCFRGENSHLFQEHYDTLLILGKFSSAVKNKIFIRFQLSSSQYPKTFVWITNKLVLKDRPIDCTLWFTVIALLTQSHVRLFMEVWLCIYYKSVFFMETGPQN